MARPDPNPADPLATLRTARGAVRQVVIDLARRAGAKTILRPVYPGAQATLGDVEPLAGMRASRQVELGARRAARDYIRQAREVGHSWQQIGESLDLVPNGDAQQTGDTIAEAAYTYAAGHPDTETALRYGRSFIWRCPSCDQAIGDRGLVSGPADDEHGHAENCPRLTAATARWEAEWEACE